MTLHKLDILLADDDQDDRFFFAKALSQVNMPTLLSEVEDGPRLMNFLDESEKLPDVLFLDLNMPRKNGAECLSEIKQHQKLKLLPVIIYSTSIHDELANLLYQRGAHYYMRKTSVENLYHTLSNILPKLIANEFTRPSRDQFELLIPVISK